MILGRVLARHAFGHVGREQDVQRILRVPPDPRVERRARRVVRPGSRKAARVREAESAAAGNPRSLHLEVAHAVRGTQLVVDPVLIVDLRRHDAAVKPKIATDCAGPVMCGASAPGEKRVADRTLLG